ncbi:MAG TPA: hypothetical protein H9903_10565 [Candidatus Aquabacterium excrementipullorum]|nr:hypothetical protein [Candidatus Aquabacterium excrementipullorum]
MSISTNVKFMAAAGLGMVALLVYLQKKNLLAGAAAGAVGAVADVGAGLALGIGDLFGVPRTDEAKCAAAKASGSLWDQSMYCPALTFASSGTAEVIQSIGDVVGIPRTNETECQRAIREGRTWDASFACPAGTFLSYTFGL